MSDIKVNGNTYTGVTSVKLMKADESGYAEYTESAEATDSVMDTLIANGSLGDIERDDASPGLEWMTGYRVGTVSFPYATKLNGAPVKITAENLLFPNVKTVSAISCGNSGWRSYGFNNCKITGTLDLSSLETVSNNALTFTTSVIGTLKLGTYAPNKNIWAALTVTNFVWNGLTAASLSQNSFFEYFKSAVITNLYVPAELKERFQTQIDNGTLTKITNLYSLDEWED